MMHLQWHLMIRIIDAPIAIALAHLVAHGNPTWVG
jgi:hypothetical protein